MTVASSNQSPGRPSKLTPELAAQIVASVREGLHLSTAAERHGIHRDTLHEWRRKGDSEAAGPLREFSDALRRARAEAVADMASVIVKSAKTDPRWAAWWLQHAAPQEWMPAIAINEQKADESGLSALIRGF